MRTASEPFRWSRILLGLLSIGALFAIDRRLMGWLEGAAGDALICPAYPAIDPACARTIAEAHPSLAVTGWALAGCCALILAARALLRSKTIYPGVVALLALAVLTLLADAALGVARLSPDAAAVAYLFVSLGMAAALVTGAMMSEAPPLRKLALAAALYALALSFRFASFQLTLGLWPHLFDATRLAALYLLTVLGCSIMAVLCFVGPMAFATAPVAPSRRDASGAAKRPGA